ncbi:MAG: hypothetical protein M3Q03_07500, partial [Chloroflexota bacterium]|nr:hypothetical protein [Chloroflexota bacterium]
KKSGTRHKKTLSAFVAARGANIGNGRAGQYGSTTLALRRLEGTLAYCRAADPRIPCTCVF